MRSPIFLILVAGAIVSAGAFDSRNFSCSFGNLPEKCFAYWCNGTGGCGWCNATGSCLGRDGGDECPGGAWLEPADDYRCYSIDAWFACMVVLFSLMLAFGCLCIVGNVWGESSRRATKKKSRAGYEAIS